MRKQHESGAFSSKRRTSLLSSAAAVALHEGLRCSEAATCSLFNQVRSAHGDDGTCAVKSGHFLPTSAGRGRFQQLLLLLLLHPKYLWCLRGC